MEKQIAIRHQYTAAFEELWKSYSWLHNKGIATKGSKIKAFQEWQKVAGNEAELLEVVKVELRKQAQERIRKGQAGQWFDILPHLERWIKYQRWEDTIGDDQEMQLIDERAEKIAQMTDTSWADHLIRRH